ncbi:MAG: ribonuclease HII [Erysipelotrichia bacterium]|nr:ribonuclease HII [Erysipelotrichia bacterium]
MKNFLEKDYYSDEVLYIVGVDEAGRGPLAGPLVACALILKKDYNNELINDSKKLSEKIRLLLFDEILENSHAYYISVIDPKTIDEINILNATKKAMQEALSNLNHRIDLIFTDAVKLDNFDVPLYPIVKGDQKVKAIAAASIIAKVTRDNLMFELHKQYPLYRFDLHKGYPTKLHLQLLKKYGPIKNIHRFSYKPIRRLNKLSLFENN